MPDKTLGGQVKMGQARAFQTEITAHAHAGQSERTVRVPENWSAFPRHPREHPGHRPPWAYRQQAL